MQSKKPIYSKKPCSFCGNIFQSTWSNSKFCSLACAFWSKVEKRSRKKCWPWHGAKTKGKKHENIGYGCFTYGGKLHRAHRIAWVLHFGSIPKEYSYHGICVLHHCDNPKCVNPSHLFLGTFKDNTMDMHEKGRAAWPNVKLTAEQIGEIRKKYAAGDVSYRELGIEYEIDLSQIGNIVTGKCWKNVDCSLCIKAKKVRKLISEEVKEIRERYAVGDIFQRKLAKEFNVTQTTISKIIKKEIWRD